MNPPQALAAALFPQVTLLFAAGCALLQVTLTVLVIQRRRSVKIGFLDGGDDALLRRIRVHGNFTETVPMALLLLAMLEMSGMPATWILVFGCTILTSRLLHAWGLLLGAGLFGRFGGTLLMLMLLTGQGLVGLWIFWR